MTKPFEELVKKTYDRIARKTILYAYEWYQYSERLEKEGKLEEAIGELKEKARVIADDLETCAYASVLGRDYDTTGTLIGKAIDLYIERIEYLTQKIHDTQKEEGKR